VSKKRRLEAVAHRDSSAYQHSSFTEDILHELLSVGVDALPSLVPLFGGDFVGHFPACVLLGVLPRVQ
jgi:hypothetical protein